MSRGDRSRWFVLRVRFRGCQRYWGIALESDWNAGSTVTLQLGDLVKLTVAHDDFEPGSGVLEAISQGWPAVLSGLKTLLETGESLPAPAGARAES